jgi:hypothetical protein
MIKENKNIFGIYNIFSKLKSISKTRTKVFEICNIVTYYYTVIQKVVVSVDKSFEASSQQITTLQIH